MTLGHLYEGLDFGSEGRQLHQFITQLYPWCRSITGNGLRDSLNALKQFVPVELHEVPSGTQVLDWVVPPEWNIRDAWIADAEGKRIVDFRQHNLHVVNYSIPVRKKLTLTELKPHLYSLPEHPDWIPYRTSYYRQTWGFCLSHRQLQSLPDGEYEVYVDSTLAPGHLTYAEFKISGEGKDEFLFSAHSCHPALANDNLSAMAVAARLAQLLQGRPLRHTYRFLWAPGTIGAITWLARNRDSLGSLRGGLVLSCLGDTGKFHYKRSRRGHSCVDTVVEHVLAAAGLSHSVEDFEPMGYDERQFCSPGFDLPVGRLSRTPNGKYAEYHTSADNLEFVKSDKLGGSLDLLLKIVETWEANRTLRNLAPYGEPQLGKRGLYRTTGGVSDNTEEAALLWVLNFADGAHSLLDIARRSGLSFTAISTATDRLEKAGLLAETNGNVNDNVTGCCHPVARNVAT
jgi:aminopeptidase-like protein